MEYLDMGGYGAFVWPTYIVAAAVMVGLFVTTVKSLKSNESQLAFMKAARKDARQQKGADDDA